MPLYASVFISAMWGALTAVILWGGTLLLLVGELGGPINFVVPVLIVAVITVALAAYTARARGGGSGAICGLAFSFPIAIVLYRLAHADPVVLREHGGQFAFSAVAVVALATLVMGSVAQSRKATTTPPDSHEKDKDGS